MAVENKVNLYTALLKGGRGFIESNPVINRQTFAEYIKSLDLEKNYTGAQGIGYIKSVASNERMALADTMKLEGIADFQIFPTAEKEFYQVVLYLEPSNEAVEKMIGFDMSSDAKRREALELARDSGAAASSLRITPVKEDGAGLPTGFLICLPIYRNGVLPATIEDRRKNIIGYIYSPFRSQDFLNEVQRGGFASDVSVRIYDGEPSAETLLTQTAIPQVETFQNQIEENYNTQKEVTVAGRRWVVQYNSLPAFSAQSSVGWTPLIFIIGIIGSFLLFGMTYWETSARIKLQKTAAELFESERQKQNLLEKEQAARLSAEQANRTKDEFIAVVSHELRTPLNAIGGWTRILRTEDLSENTRTLALEKIDKNLRSQTRLVEDLLDYSQIVSGTVKLADHEVNFSEVFENIFQQVEPAAMEKNVEFIKDNRLNGHLLLGDEDKLKIVIYNLLSNAVKFTQSGGKVEVTILENDGMLQMIIKDNGRGISKDFLPRIFDRFTQADTSSTRSSGGLGLGLTISNQIIKLHKGTIQADSPGIGRGSTFTVMLPQYSHRA